MQTESLPLDIAISKKNLLLVKILSANLERIPASTYKIAYEEKNKDFTSKKIFDFFTEKYKKKKKAILAEKPLLSVTEKNVPIYPTEAICSQIYYEGNKSSAILGERFF